MDKKIYCSECNKRFQMSSVMFTVSKTGLEKPACPNCQFEINLSLLEMSQDFIKDSMQKVREVLQTSCKEENKDIRSYTMQFMHLISKREILGSVLIWENSTPDDETASEFDEKNLREGLYFPYYRTVIGRELDLLNFPYPAIYTYVEIQNDKIIKTPVIDPLLN